MATRIALPRAKPLTPDLFERILTIGAVVMLFAVLAAIARGQAHWAEMKPLIWFHLVTILVALALTPPLLWQRRGTQRHRRLGWVWAAAMFSTAFASLFIHESGPGRFSPIHLLSLLTLVGVPGIVISARKHLVERHRFAVRATVLGALLIAGFFTFPFGRLLGRWLFAA